MRVNNLLMAAMALGLSMGGFAKAQTATCPSGTVIPSGRVIIGTVKGTVANGSPCPVAGGDALAALAAQKGAANGLAPLDSTSKVPLANLPAAGTLGALVASNNLSDVISTATARVNLGLGGAAVLNVGTTTGTVPDAGAVYGAINTEATTARNASNLTSGTVAAVRLPAISALAGYVDPTNASNITSGTLATVRLSVGTASGTIAAGNDSRIVGAIQSSSLGQPSGPATLDANTKVSASTLVNRAAISPLTTSITNAPVGVYPPGNYVAISIMSPDQTITCRGDGTLPVINAAGYTAAPGYYLIWPAIGTVDTPTNVVRCVASGATTIVTTAR